MLAAKHNFCPARSVLCGYVNDKAGRIATRFEEIVSADRYRDCWRYCCRLSDDRFQAEDLLQEALVRAAVGAAQLKDSTKARGWLFSIIRTAHIDRLRKARSRPQTIAGEFSGNHASLQRENYPDQASDGIVELALARLPANQRELIELFHVEDLSLQETAIALGVSVNTVKQRLLRARAALKRQLKPSFEAGDLAELF